jgi:ribonucleoside-triphosphate reductase
LYDVENSSLKKVQKSIVTVSKDDVQIAPQATTKYLFTTSTCPNCVIAKEMLHGEEYQVVDAEKNPEMAMEYGIMQAPTLVVVNGDGAVKYVNASNIQKYVDMRG